MAVALLLFSCVAYGGSLDDLYRKASEGGQYRIPLENEVSEAQGLFEKTLASPATNFKDAWAALHFEWTEFSDGKCTGVVIQESPDARQGRGFYVIRRGEAVPIALEMPHCPSDLHTDSIGLSMFTEIPFAAAAWNTVRRDAGGKNKETSSDLAHAQRTFFSAFSLAFARSFPKGRIVQMHGFGNEEHSDLESKGVEMVLSAGSLTPSVTVKTLFPVLDQAFPGEVLLYTKGVESLGGTTNAQGKALRAAGFDGFVHVEMNQVLRKRLKNESEARALFAAALKEGLPQ